MRGRPTGCWLTLNLDDVVDAQVDDDEDEEDTVATNGKAPKATERSSPRSRGRSSTKPSFPRISHIGGVRLLFPGDAQYGAWESVRSDRESLDLISNVDF